MNKAIHKYHVYRKSLEDKDIKTYFGELIATVCSEITASHIVAGLQVISKDYEYIFRPEISIVEFGEHIMDAIE